MIYVEESLSSDGSVTMFSPTRNAVDRRNDGIIVSQNTWQDQTDTHMSYLETRQASESCFRSQKLKKLTCFGLFKIYHG